MYNPATDFVGLWRNSGGTVSKMEMPGLDFVISAMARAGLLTVSVSATAPVANQAVTAWLQTAVPSWAGEGTFYLWNKTTSAYAPATPTLFFQFLEACAGVSGISLWSTTGGPPLNTVGSDGDYAIRSDDPGGIYGPKTLGAWPADPLPGSSNVIESSALDNTFGTNVGSVIYRDAALWAARTIGVPGSILAVAAGLPEWEDLTSLFDVAFGTEQGAVLYRGAAAWEKLSPGVDNTVLTTHGAGVDPSWTPKSTEFSSGDTMIFRQTAAPIGWTKQTTLDNCGLRVVSGAVGTTAGSPFSTVFSQQVVGDTALSADQMPVHNHDIVIPNRYVYFNGSESSGNIFYVPQAGKTGTTGGGAPHNHTINLSLAYTDVIIATKD